MQQHFDPEFWDRRLNDLQLAPIPRSAHSGTVRGSDTPSGRTRICIPLSSKPRDYVPGSGPPLQRIQLLPPRDSTAYIIERLLLPSPGPAANGNPLPRRMTYLVGWYDLPAARMLVPAMQILDYVSPLALEEWEWQLEQELDEERAKLEQEEQSAATSTSTKKRKPGRPPAHSQIEPAVVAESETVAKAKARPKKGVMSLSSPHKTRLDEFEGLSDLEASPSRQLAEEEFQSLQGSRLEEFERAEGGGMDDLTAPASRPSPILLEPRIEENTSANMVELENIPRPPTPGWSWTPSDFGNGTKTPRKQKILQQRPPSKKKNLEKGTPTTSSFTPAGKSTGRIPSETTPADITETNASASKGSKGAPNSKPKSAKKRPRVEEQPLQNAQPENKAPDSAEKDWVVERIEGVEYYEVEGRGVVRYFKVRWEGDWPPDQNPTWEPEENLPPNLVRNFFKTPKKRRTSTQQKSGNTPKPKKLAAPWSMGKQYNSVSEAFAGDQDNVSMGNGISGHEDQDYGNGNGNGNDDGDGDEQDEFFVVAEDEDGGRGTLHGGLGWNGNGAKSPALGVFSAFT